MPTNRNKAGKQAVLFLKIVHSRCSVLWSAMAKCGSVTKKCRRQRDWVVKYGWGTRRGSSRLSSLRYRGAKVNSGYAWRRFDGSESTDREPRAARRGWSTVTKDRAVCLREATGLRRNTHSTCGANTRERWTSPRNVPLPHQHTRPGLRCSHYPGSRHNNTTAKASLTEPGKKIWKDRSIPRHTTLVQTRGWPTGCVRKRGEASGELHTPSFRNLSQDSGSHSSGFWAFSFQEPWKNFWEAGILRGSSTLLDT